MKHLLRLFISLLGLIYSSSADIMTIILFEDSVRNQRFYKPKSIKTTILNSNYSNDPKTNPQKAQTQRILENDKKAL